MKRAVKNYSTLEMIISSSLIISNCGSLEFVSIPENREHDVVTGHYQLEFQ